MTNIDRSKSSRIAPELASLLRYAVTAPSSHNTQPWRFRVKDHRVCVLADRTRALPANDPHDRELTISCGCALMNLRVAAAQHGFAAVTRLLPDARRPDLLASVDLAKSDDAGNDVAALFPAITERRTYRKPFEDRPVPEAVQQQLAAAVREEAAWLELLTDPAPRNDIATLVAEGDAAQWSNPQWRRELAAWMRARRCGDGLTVPRPLAPLARMLVRNVDMGKQVGSANRRLATQSPVLAVLGTGHDGASEWLQAGQALQRMVLLACHEGLQVSYLNQPVQVAALRDRLRDRLTHAGFPQIVLRMGYPTKTLPSTPRRDLTDVIEPDVE